ncbi:hypothetical protein [Rhodococcoides fascians]|uniref:hypothetical protein n=1 Tax=Rhodococcoides fascians TaxID=1828 RepID=UPI000A723CD4|nr:hypothetical protein [Rhodococcus fascians]
MDDNQTAEDKYLFANIDWTRLRASLGDSVDWSEHGKIIYDTDGNVLGRTVFTF